MKFSVHADDVTQHQAGVLGLYCYEDSFGESPPFRALDKALDGLLGKLAAEEQFKAKRGQSLLLHTHGKVGAQRVLLVGAGPRKEWNASDLRGFASRVVKTAVSVQ